MRSLFFILLLFLSTRSSFATQGVPFALGLNEGAYEFSLWGSLQNSSFSWDSDGEKISFKDAEAYSLLDVELQASYGWTQEIEVGTSVRYRSVSDTILPSGETETLSLRANGLESVKLYVKYMFPQVKKMLYSVQAGFRRYLYSNNELDSSKPYDFTILGDGGNVIEVGLNANYFFSKSKSYLGGKLFFRNPGKTLSEEILTQLEGAYFLGKFSFLLGVENVFSLGRDEYSDDPENKPAIVQSRSALFNSINRSWTNAYLGVNFYLGRRWILGARYEKRLQGKSTDSIDRVSFGLTLRADSDKEIKETISSYKEYSHEAFVVKISPKKKYIMLDKGLSKGIQKGMQFDIYDFDYSGNNKLIARGVIVQAQAYKSVIKVLKMYTSQPIKEGQVARGSL